MDHAARPDLDPRALRRLDGFGLATPSDAYVRRPSTVEGLVQVVEEARRAGRRIVARGAGRAYGDAATLPEEIALDTTRLTRVHGWDPVSGVIDVGAGMTFEGLWRMTLEDGWWPPVVTGTAKPTLGGALAVNVHGKNNPAHGTIAEWIDEVEIVDGRGRLRVLTPGDEPFRAVAGGLGLMGVVTRVRLRLKPVVSGLVLARTVRTTSWDETFAAFDGSDAEYRVASVDPFQPSGRALFGDADHDPSPDPRSLWPEYHDPREGWIARARLPDLLRHVTNRTDLRALSALRWRAVPEGVRRRPIAGFNFQLDAVPGWQRAYGPGHLIQFQTCVPEPAAREILPRLMEMTRRARLEPYLAVLKRHRPDPGVLGYLNDGFSLALDFQRGPWNAVRLNALLDEMADLALGAGGRFYPAKDAILTPERYARSVGEDGLARFRRLRAGFDPDGLFASALTDRVGLTL